MRLFGGEINRPGRYIIAIVLIVLASTIVIIFTNNYLNRMTEESLVEISKQGAKTVENKIAWSFDKLEGISRLKTMRGSTDIDDKLLLLKDIDEWDDTYDFGFIDTSGQFHIAYGDSYNVKNEYFFSRAMAGEKTMETVEVKQFGDYPAIAFSVPVYDFDGTSIIGVVCIVYSAEQFCQLVEDTAFGDEGIGCLVDYSGLIIAHPDRSIVKEKKDWLLETINNPELDELSDLGQRMIRGEIGAGKFIINGNRKIMGFSPINDTKWSFLAISPANDSFNDITPMLALVSVIMGLFLVAYIRVNYYFTSLNQKIQKEERSLKTAVETGKLIVISFLSDGTIIEFNTNAEESLGYLQEDVVKVFRIFDFLNFYEQDKLRKIMDECLKNENVEIENSEISLSCSTGETEHLLYNLNLLNRQSATPVFELIGFGITDRVNYEIQLIEKHEELSAVYEQLAASEQELKNQLDELIEQRQKLLEKDQRYNLVVEASNIGIWEWDVESDTYFYSDKWYEIFEIDESEIEGSIHKKRGFQEEIIFEEDLDNFVEAYLNHLKNKTDFYECEYRIKTPKGNVKWIHTVGKALFDDNGNPLIMAGSNTDITSKKESEKKIHKLAYYDSLTGLANRSSFNVCFDELVAQDTRNIAIAIIDIYNFKLINDSYGHDVGDLLLIEVAKRLQNKQTDRMHLCRIGGDDYAIMLYDYSDVEELGNIVEEIIDYLDVTIKIDIYEVNLSVNAGIAMYPKDGKNFEDLLKNADTAKYRAYEQRSKYVYFDAKMNDVLVEKLSLMNSLKVALDNDEFIIYYQPQYSLPDRRIMGFEALIRWNSPVLGMVSPGRFIPIAEESGAIIPLGSWILEESIKFIKRIHELGHDDLIISVNTSVIQFTQEKFAQEVMQLLDKYDLSPEMLELEITESIMMDNVETVMNNLATVEEAGISLALDDFGTGYSSLNYLTKLPIKTLKIDKSFIDTIGSDTEKDILLDNIIDIGHGLGLSIVAEGVETGNQYMYLEKMDCERVQGYYFSRPVPEEQIIDMLEEQTSKLHK